MPIYEYRCADCGEHSEKMQKVSDAPLTVCEKCGGKLEKQWSRSGFQFKGEGWYVTDYSDKGKAAAKSEPKAETKSEKSSPGESTAKSDGASNSKETTTSKPAKKE